MHPPSSNNSSFQYDLKEFTFERILDENTNAHFLIVLGTLPAPNAGRDANADANPNDASAVTTRVNRLPAILRMEKTAFPPSFTTELSSSVIASTRLIEHTDIYSWMHGWLERKEDLPDVKINVIFPATEVHIRKYTKQELLMVSETPKLYREIVKPYMDALPASRTQWIRDIISGTSESNRILYRSPNFLILPDMKWDPNGPISSLYLLAIVCDPSVRSLRDLRGHGGQSEDGCSGEGHGHGHVEMLEDLRERAWDVLRERWGLGRGSVRMYVHYQPSYYHFHVHIVHASQAGMMGMTVGQAHLLDDLISMLKRSPDILSEMTFTYALGSQHGLYDAMIAAQVDSDEVETQVHRMDRIEGKDITMCVILPSMGSSNPAKPRFLARSIAQGAIS